MWLFVSYFHLYLSSRRREYLVVCMNNFLLGKCRRRRRLGYKTMEGRMETRLFNIRSMLVPKPCSGKKLLKRYVQEKVGLRWYVILSRCFQRKAIEIAQ